MFVFRKNKKKSFKEKVTKSRQIVNHHLEQIRWKRHLLLYNILYDINNIYMINNNYKLFLIYH